MPTLKELAATAQVVTQTGLERSLTELKNYIDSRDTADKAALQGQIDALIGAAGGDTDKLLNTFNDIKAFLADYSEDNTLKSLLDAVNIAIGEEQMRAMNAEAALAGRIKTLEDVSVMTSEQAKALFDSVFTDSDSSN